MVSSRLCMGVAMLNLQVPHKVTTSKALRAAVPASCLCLLSYARIRLSHSMTDSRASPEELFRAQHLPLFFSGLVVETRAWIL